MASSSSALSLEVPGPCAWRSDALGGWLRGCSRVAEMVKVTVGGVRVPGSGRWRLRAMASAARTQRAVAYAAVAAERDLPRLSRP